MRAINHALTGAVIGLSIDNVELALPAAFLSHFVCDAIPHYGFGDMPEKGIERALKSNLFKNTLILDAFLCFVLVVILALSRPKNWLAACICAFLAASPDFLLVTRFMTAKQGKKYAPTKLNKFLSDIQWFERPSGAVIEVAWFLVFSFLVWNLAR